MKEAPVEAFYGEATPNYANIRSHKKICPAVQVNVNV